MFSLRAFVISLAFLSAARCSFAADTWQAGNTAWVTGNLQGLNASVDAEAVQSILRRALADSSSKITWDADDPALQVSDFGFFDLRGDGKLELLAVLDYSGRGISTCLATVMRTESHLSVSLLDTTVFKGGGGELGTLSNSIKDLEGNGHLELIVSKVISDRKDRSSPAAFFNNIYVYEFGKFVLSDNLFRSYYQQVVIPELQASVASKQAVIAAENTSGILPAHRLKSQKELIALEQSLDATKGFLGTGIAP